jgi:CDP-paratose 2-epimerase
MIEAIQICEQIAERKLNWTYADTNRVGDHIWWISDNGKFSHHYPNWQLKYNVNQILQEIYQFNVERWQKEVVGK